MGKDKHERVRWARKVGLITIISTLKVFTGDGSLGDKLAALTLLAWVEYRASGTCRMTQHSIHFSFPLSFLNFAPLPT